MDAHTAEMILYTITTVAAIVWLAGLRFLIRCGQTGHETAGEDADQFGPSVEPNQHLVHGSAEVNGQPAELCVRAASQLAGGGATSLGLIQILEQTNDRLTFKPAGAMGGVARRVQRGQLRFTALGPGRTRIDYAVSMSRRRGLLVAGVIVQFIGLIAVALGFWLIHSYVVPNPNMGVRGQVFQMFQVVHFLWPPFLLGSLHRAFDRWVRAAMDALIHNLPYLKGQN